MTSSINDPVEVWLDIPGYEGEYQAQQPRSYKESASTLDKHKAREDIPMVGIMEKIYVDVETYSEVDLKECGVFRYADDPSFEVMLFAFAYGDDPVKVIDIAQGEKIPFYVLDDLYDSGVLKLAHNAQFEITCLSRWFGKELPPEQWECTAVRASTLGLPRSLAGVGDALGLKEDEKKMAIGKRLVQYFARPCLPTKTNGGRRRNFPHHEPEKWALYKEYNAQDVVTERAIYKAMENTPLQSNGSGNCGGSTRKLTRPVCWLTGHSHKTL